MLSIHLPSYISVHALSYSVANHNQSINHKGNGGGFIKMLFRRRFTHCAMAIPFILLSPLQGVNLTFKGDDSLLRLLLITSHK